MHKMYALLKDEADPVTDIFSSLKAKFSSLLHVVSKKGEVLINTEVHL